MAATARLGKITEVLHEKLLAVHGPDPANPQRKPSVFGTVWDV